jgi:VanZ family protein
MAVPLLWAAIIFFAYSIPGNDLAYTDPWDILKFDKIVHFTLFAVFVLVLVIAFKKQRQIRFVHFYSRAYAVSIAILYGTALELVQGIFFIGRFSDPLDFVANAIGAFGGLLLFRLIYGRSVNYW